MRPHDSIDREHSTRGQFFFAATQEIGDGLAFTVEIDELAIEELSGKARFSVRGELHDYRVEGLCSFLRGYGMAGICRVDFNVLAAFNWMQQRATPRLPMHDLGMNDAEVEATLRGYCAKIDRTWKFFGMRNPTSFAAMASWMLRNGDPVGLIMDHLQKIVAAFVFGERRLALRFIDEYLADWDDRERDQSDNPAVAEVAKEVRAEVDRIRQIIK